MEIYTRKICATNVRFRCVATLIDWNGFLSVVGLPFYSYQFLGIDDHLSF